MKMFFAAVGFFFMCAGRFLIADGDFIQERLDRERLSQGRSLKDILEQYGKPLEPGRIILTADGILNDESSNSQKLAKLNHRVAKLTLVKDFELTEDILPKFKSRRTSSSLPLVAYVRKVFKDEPIPLLAFAATVIEEKNEIDAIQTEALELMSDKSCRANCLEISRNLNLYQVVLIELGQMINGLWEEMVALLPENYASSGE